MSEQNITYQKTTTLSGNVVVFVPQSLTQLARVCVYTPDKVWIRGSLGDAATEYWQKVSEGKQVTTGHDWSQLIESLTVWSKLEEEFPNSLPKKEVQLTMISDRVVESSIFGDACKDRHRFYRVTNLCSLYTDRDQFVTGNFELLFVWFHVLSAGKIAIVKRIWEHGKEGSQAPSGYIRRVINNLGNPECLNALLYKEG